MSLFQISKNVTNSVSMREEFNKEIEKNLKRTLKNYFFSKKKLIFQSSLYKHSLSARNCQYLLRNVFISI